MAATGSRDDARNGRRLMRRHRRGNCPTHGGEILGCALHRRGGHKVARHLRQTGFLRRRITFVDDAIGNTRIARQMAQCRDRQICAIRFAQLAGAGL